MHHTPRNARLSRLSASALACILASCAQPTADEVLRTAIRTEVVREGFVFEPDPTMAPYLTGAEPSRVLPLSYHWALYFPRELSHGWFSAVAAERDGNTVLLRGVNDWIQLSGAWRASTADQAVQACGEIIRFAGPRSIPFNLPVIAAPSFPVEVRAGDPEVLDSLMASLDGPAVSGDSDGWTVELWAAEMARTAKYSCALPKVGGAAPPVLAVVDSLDFGLFADEH